jgi:hypothetical protein
MQSPQQPDQALSLIIGALAVDVFGLALAPSFLRAICSIPSFGIAKFAVNVCSPDTNTIPTKMPTNRTAGIGREQTVTNTDVRGSAYFSRVSEHCADGRGRFGTGLNSLIGAPGRNRTEERSETPCGSTAYLRLYDDALSRATEGFPALC